MLDPNKPALPKYHFTIDGATVNTFHIEIAGDGHPKHQHTWDHVTLVHAGRLKVRTQHNGEFEMTKDTKPIVFPANQWHELEALEDGTVFTNVFAVGKESQLLPTDM